MNRYYAKFNENGERETSIAFNVHFTNAEELQPYLDHGFEPITDEEQALYATNKYLRGTDGKSVEKPLYEPAADEKMVAIRVERDRLLAESDKYMLSDYPITDTEREQWKVYRQELRNISETCDVNNVVWPALPLPDDCIV